VYHLPRFFILRSGLDRVFEGPATARLPLSAGFGLRYGNFMLDYAFTPQEYFENTHTFSVGVSFGGGSGVIQTGEPVYGAIERAVPVAGAQPAATARQDVSDSAGTATPGSKPTPATTYAIVAGSHARVESAESEARALTLVKVPATVEADQDAFVVVVGRYASQKEAKKALIRYENRGHRFEIRPEPH
jgi:hypothetical protein